MCQRPVQVLDPYVPATSLSASVKHEVSLAVIAALLVHDANLLLVDVTSCLDDVAQYHMHDVMALLLEALH